MYGSDLGSRMAHVGRIFETHLCSSVSAGAPKHLQPHFFTGMRVLVSAHLSHLPSRGTMAPFAELCRIRG